MKEIFNSDKFKNIDLSLLHNRCWRLRSLRACLLHRTLTLDRHEDSSVYLKHTDLTRRRGIHPVSATSGYLCRFHACTGSAGQFIHDHERYGELKKRPAAPLPVWHKWIQFIWLRYGFGRASVSAQEAPLGGARVVGKCGDAADVTEL